MSIRSDTVGRLYVQHLGRQPTDTELAAGTAMDAHGAFSLSIAEIIANIQNTSEYYRRATMLGQRQPFIKDLGNIGIGLNEDPGTTLQNQFFDSADYTHALYEGGEYNVRRTRQKIIDWLRNPSTGAHWLRDQDKEGQAGGLMEKITKHASMKGVTPETHWGDVKTYPEAGKWFNFPDLHATRAMGFSELEIQQWLDEDIEGRLEPHHRPYLPDGTGGNRHGVYEAVRSGAPIDPTLEPLTITQDVSGPWDIKTKGIIPEPQDLAGADIIDKDNKRVSLNIEPNTARNIWMEGNLRAGTGGINRKRVRPKYTSTEDLNRERRNSLNIS